MIPPSANNTAKRRRVTLCVTTVLCLIVSDLAVRRAHSVLKGYDVLAYNNDDFQRKPVALKKMQMPDIMLMGSSRTRYALVPDEFEKLLERTAYNLGINGAQTVEWLVMARDLFSRQKPKLVILGVNAGEFRVCYRPTVAARYLFGWNDLVESMTRDDLSLGVLLPCLRHWIGPSWATYERRFELKMWGQQCASRWYSEWGRASRRLRENIARRDPYGEALAPPKGYDHPWLHGVRLHDFDRYADALVTQKPVYAQETIPFQRLDQFLGWLQQQGISTVVTYLPNSPQTESNWRGVEQRMIRAIGTVCRAHHVPFFQSTQSLLPRTNADYLDEVHVGYALALRISRHVARYIEKLAILGEVSSPRWAQQPKPTADHL